MSSQPPRRSASQRRTVSRKQGNPYTTTSASMRRAQERARSGQSLPDVVTAGPRKGKSALTQDQIADILAHPTRQVSTEELRHDYGYVLRDIRSMFLLAGGLVVAELVLSFVLPR